MSEAITQFYIESHRVATEAQFIIHSLPNAEIPAVERVILQLDAIRTILRELDDEYAEPQEIEHLIDLCNVLLNPLEAFIAAPPPPARSNVETESSGRRGRPSYKLDVERARELHSLGNSWKDVASALGVDRKTLYNHIRAAGFSACRPEYTEISDEELDELVKEISQSHPFSGIAIIDGHMKGRGFRLPRERIQESLRRVDPLGVLVRWAGIIKRCVYRVRGSNALWHMDGNEKLKPWGFYVHGCIDGFSRLIIYLVCASNKRARTVESCFKQAVTFYGWPSRVRGDFGTENNEVERRVIERWGEAHHAFLRGRSLHNVRIERLWRDVRKDSLEFFRQIFFYLQELELLDMEFEIHRVCLFLTFHKRIQDSLNRTRDAWNHHKLRTEHNRTPVALYALSRQIAITQGYWTGDPGDRVEDVVADPEYGVDRQAPAPPADELRADACGPSEEPLPDVSAERDAGVTINADDELEKARRVMADFDFDRDDGNWGIDVYVQAVCLYSTRILQ